MSNCADPFRQTLAVSPGEAVVRGLWRYPVKSLCGEQLEAASLDRRGVVGDRAFAVRDASGKFGSGKTTRRFRLLRDLFEFRAETDGDDVLVRGPKGVCMRVGDPELDALLSARYGEPLVVRPEETIPHFDAGAVHVLTTSSLRWVDAGYGHTSGDARRYRPNILVDTRGAGLTEEQWLGTTLSIGSCALRVTATVERCVMVNNAQGELPQDNGLLWFLARECHAMVGVYADVVSPGEIRVGDVVTATPD
jgi:uncharacterized protein YcbX